MIRAQASGMGPRLKKFLRSEVKGFSKGLEALT
jgi:hypothetical protein